MTIKQHCLTFFIVTGTGAPFHGAITTISVFASIILNKSSFVKIFGLLFIFLNIKIE